MVRQILPAELCVLDTLSTFLHAVYSSIFVIPSCYRASELGHVRSFLGKHKALSSQCIQAAF